MKKGIGALCSGIMLFNMAVVKGEGAAFPEVKGLEIKINPTVDGAPKSWSSILESSVKKGFGWQIEQATKTTLQNVITPCMEWMMTRYAALKKYGAFRNTDAILTKEALDELKQIVHEMLDNVMKADTNSHTYQFLVQDMHEVISRIKDRLQIARQEYGTAYRKVHLYSLQKRAASAVTRTLGTDYQVDEIIYHINRICKYLDEIRERSAARATSDIKDFKELLTNSQKTLDSLFERLARKV